MTLRLGRPLLRCLRNISTPSGSVSSLLIGDISCHPRIPTSEAIQGASRPSRRWTSTDSRFAAKEDQDSFLNGGTSSYLNDLYVTWLNNPGAIDASWKSFFERHLPTLVEATPPATLLSSLSSNATSSSATNSDPRKPCAEVILTHMKVQLLVRAYQVRGHHRANLDPLGILKPDLDFCPAPELDLSFYGLSNHQLSQEFALGEGMLPHFRTEQKRTMTLKEIVEKLEEIYCGPIGFEYMHIPDRHKCDWIRERIEIPSKFRYTPEQKMVMLDRLAWSDSFERFVHSKYPGEKRFGLEGCEALIPGMKALIDRSVENGVESIVLGMAHRGRLNVLSNVVRKPNESIFCEFNGESDPTVAGSGDVKYHLGMNYERPTPSGKRVYLSLVANPSHLEAVNPVVQGKTKALQFYLQDNNCDKVVGVLLHGDASFAAQGVVYESLGLCDLPSYSTGGTIHLVINNQIGFTTDPRFARSTPYCTEIAKCVNAPILHVNADDIEAVVFACEFAADWRKTFKKDIVVDIVCYRRHGHNEFDEPGFTQPRMYRAISKKVRALDIYISKLIQENTLTKDEVDKVKSRVWSMLEETYDQAKKYQPTVKEWLTSTWNGFKSPKEVATTVCPSYDTGVDESSLRHIGTVLSTVPSDFELHKGLVKVFEARKKAIESGEGIDFATAEALGFGTLLMEGNHVRLSGQDVERGTFSSRHAVLHDQNNEHHEACYIPLSHLSPTQAPFVVCNSSLSEFGILGFELGYSLVNPRSLICWEAQFGDFSNNSQCIIDQFLVSGERKWIQRSGLVMLLPHGFDGNGPEHSSARLERFLQLCDDDPSCYPETDPVLARQIQDCNIQVVYPSTPANYFHVLRRQLHRDFRKPLIVMNSKALLRHPMARSNMSEFADNTRFRAVLPEAHPEDIHTSKDKIKNLIFCSGQVYYQLIKTRQANHVKHTAIVRLEQLSPFPYADIMQILQSYPHLHKITWVQEEPINMGAWTYVYPRFVTTFKQFHKTTGSHSKKSSSTHKREDSDGEEGSFPHDILVVARPPSAAVATGLKKIHHHEELDLLSKALFDKALKPKKEVNGVPIF